MTDRTDVDLAQATWRKSSRSGGGQQCVEVAAVGAARAVRDSKDPDGAALRFAAPAFARFLAAAKRGDYDA